MKFVRSATEWQWASSAQWESEWPNLDLPILFKTIWIIFLGLMMKSIIGNGLESIRVLGPQYYIHQWNTFSTSLPVLEQTQPQADSYGHNRNISCKHSKYFLLSRTDGQQFKTTINQETLPSCVPSTKWSLTLFLNIWMNISQLIHFLVFKF